MIKIGRFTIHGVEFKVSEITADHEFSFTPAISLFIESETADELEKAFARLAENGSTLMAPDNHGFSRRFGWVQDRFGVSWQLNLSSWPRGVDGQADQIPISDWTVRQTWRPKPPHESA